MNDSILDLINEPITNEDLQPTLFPDGAVVTFQVKSAKHNNETDAVSIKNQFEFELVTVNKEKNTKGQEFEVGRTFTHRIFLNTTSKKGVDIKDLVKRRLAQFREACGLPIPAPFGSPDNYIGQRVVALMEIESSDEYGKQNRITRFIKPA